MRNKETDIKEKFENLVKKAKQVELCVKRCIDFIDSATYEEVYINSNNYYMTY